MPTTLSPSSTVSAIILPVTGSPGDVAATLPFGMYTGSAEFLSGAADQVAYTYKKLGGDVVDIELTVGNVYSAYEEAVLEYSNIVNSHQAANILSDALGHDTGSFTSKGGLSSGSDIALKYPKFQIAQARRVGDTVATEAGFGGTTRIYSGSFKTENNKQVYDVQEIVNSASLSGVDQDGNTVGYSGSVNNKRIIIDKVYYKSPRAMWRFYGYYGGLGVVGNASTYGQYADDSTFEIIPSWHNKLQAIMYEDSIYTRTSHYSYEIFDNRIKIYPSPSGEGITGIDLQRIWFRFHIQDNPWESSGSYNNGVDGINNYNTLPFGNISFDKINSMGQQWIRKYALALSKEMLGQIRGKFATIPIPGQSVNLNAGELLSQAKDEQSNLRDKLIEMLKTMEYKELAKADKERVDASVDVLAKIPNPIFVG
jgi:hypothetical protein